jgi:hypothetical protein
MELIMVCVIGGIWDVLFRLPQRRNSTRRSELPLTELESGNTDSLLCLVVVADQLSVD